MSETVSSANRRMACLWCGTSGATPVRTTRGENPGRNLRVCRACAHHWDGYGLVVRELIADETDPNSVGAAP